MWMNRGKKRRTNNNKSLVILCRIANKNCNDIFSNYTMGHCLRGIGKGQRWDLLARDLIDFLYYQYFGLGNWKTKFGYTNAIYV